MHDLQQTLAMVLDYIKGIWIKKRFVILFSWIICPIGFIYVYMLPDVYQSSALVYADTRSQIHPLLRGISIQSNPEEEVEQMAQNLLSQENVEQIARDADLDLVATSDSAFQAEVLRLQEQIQLKRTSKKNQYSISYQDQNAQLSQRIVQETLDLFVEGALVQNRRDTDKAGRFLEEQISEYENRLSEAEQRLSNFKRQYNDILPLQGTFYSTLQAYNSELQNSELQIMQLQEQVASLEEENTSEVIPDSFSVTQQDTEVFSTRYDERIQALEAQLDELTIRYTEKHPDVIETKQIIESLEARRQIELDNYIAAQKGETNEDGEVITPPTPVNSELKIEISRLKSQIAAEKVNEESLTKRIADLESKIDLVPQIEAEAVALNRDYDITKKKYEELLARREAATITRQAEMSAEELKFRIIEPPMLPERPSGPKRVLLYTVILILGFGAGIGVAFMVSQFSPVVMRANQLTQLTNIPVLGSVSHLHMDTLVKRNRVRLLIFGMSSGAILFLYSTLVAAELMNIRLLERFL